MPTGDAKPNPPRTARAPRGGRERDGRASRADREHGGDLTEAGECGRAQRPHQPADAVAVRDPQVAAHQVLRGRGDGGKEHRAGGAQCVNGGQRHRHQRRHHRSRKAGSCRAGGGCQRDCLGREAPHADRVRGVSRGEVSREWSTDLGWAVHDQRQVADRRRPAPLIGVHGNADERDPLPHHGDQVCQHEAMQARVRHLH